MFTIQMSIFLFLLFSLFSLLFLLTIIVIARVQKVQQVFCAVPGRACNLGPHRCDRRIHFGDFDLDGIVACSIGSPFDVKREILSTSASARQHVSARQLVIGEYAERSLVRTVIWRNAVLVFIQNREPPPIVMKA